jgi:hypothetical protein
MRWQFTPQELIEARQNPASLKALIESSRGWVLRSMELDGSLPGVDSLLASACAASAPFLVERLGPQGLGRSGLESLAKFFKTDSPLFLRALSGLDEPIDALDAALARGEMPAPGIALDPRRCAQSAPLIQRALRSESPCKQRAIQALALGVKSWSGAQLLALDPRVALAAPWLPLACPALSAHQAKELAMSWIARSCVEQGRAPEWDDFARWSFEPSERVWMEDLLKKRAKANALSYEDLSCVEGAQDAMPALDYALIVNPRSCLSIDEEAVKENAPALRHAWSSEIGAGPGFLGSKLALFSCSFETFSALVDEDFCAALLRRGFVLDFDFAWKRSPEGNAKRWWAMGSCAMALARMEPADALKLASAHSILNVAVELSGLGKGAQPERSAAAVSMLARRLAPRLADTRLESFESVVLGGGWLDPALAVDFCAGALEHPIPNLLAAVALAARRTSGEFHDQLSRAVDSLALACDPEQARGVLDLVGMPAPWRSIDQPRPRRSDVAGCFLEARLDAWEHAAPGARAALWDLEPALRHALEAHGQLPLEEDLLRALSRQSDWDAQLLRFWTRRHPHLKDAGSKFGAALRLSPWAWREGVAAEAAPSQTDLAQRLALDESRSLAADGSEQDQQTAVDRLDNAWHLAGLGVQEIQQACQELARGRHFQALLLALAAAPAGADDPECFKEQARAMALGDFERCLKKDPHFVNLLRWLFESRQAVEGFLDFGSERANAAAASASLEALGNVRNVLQLFKPSSRASFAASFMIESAPQTLSNDLAFSTHELLGRRLDPLEIVEVFDRLEASGRLFSPGCQPFGLASFIAKHVENEIQWDALAKLRAGRPKLTALLACGEPLRKACSKPGASSLDVDAAMPHKLKSSLDWSEVMAGAEALMQEARRRQGDPLFNQSAALRCVASIAWATTSEIVNPNAFGPSTWASPFSETDMAPLARALARGGGLGALAGYGSLGPIENFPAWAASNPQAVWGEDAWTALLEAPDAPPHPALNIEASFILAGALGWIRDAGRVDAVECLAWIVQASSWERLDLEPFQGGAVQKWAALLAGPEACAPAAAAWSSCAEWLELRHGLVPAVAAPRPRRSL